MRILLYFWLCCAFSCTTPKYNKFKLAEKKFVLADSFDISKSIDSGNSPLFIPTGYPHVAGSNFVLLEYGSYFVYSFDTLGNAALSGDNIIPYHLKNAANDFAFKQNTCFFYSNKDKFIYKISMSDGKYDSIPYSRQENILRIKAVSENDNFVFCDETYFAPQKNKDGSFNYESKRVKERKRLLLVRNDGFKKRFSVYPKFLNNRKVWNLNFGVIFDENKIYVKRVDNHLIDVYSLKARKLYSFGHNFKYYTYITKDSIKTSKKQKDLLFIPDVIAKEKGKSNFITVYPPLGKEQVVPVLYQNVEKLEYAELLVKSMYVLPYVQYGKIYTFQPRYPQKIYVYELR